MEIKVIDIRFLPDNGKSMRAFADVQFDSIVIRDFRIMKEEGKRPYVKLPFSTYKDQTGQLKFRTTIVLPDEVRGEVDLTILNAYHREKEKRNAGQISK
jgi:DNA-binding cell septation regulator SpoVG